MSWVRHEALGCLARPCLAFIGRHYPFHLMDEIEVSRLRCVCQALLVTLSIKNPAVVTTGDLSKDLVRSVLKY